MQFRVLGPLEVAAQDGPIALGGPKQRVVLANLIVRANQLVPADVLIDLVWGDDPPESARNVLQTYVSHLRKALGPGRLEGRAPGYILHLGPGELDARRFEDLVREARSLNGQADRAAPLFREALDLWRGPAFADLSTEEALRGEIARLEDLRLQAIEERIGADIACGRHVEVLGELETRTREHPLREALWGHLILALYRAGRQTDALAAFQRLRALLADELGVDPSPDLQSLHEGILRQDPDLDLEGEPLRGYRLLEQVGEGAFGVVYRATQPQIGREVAIKAVHPELANHPDFVRRFEQEAQIVARLEHPHIVPLYDYWREPDGAYLVMRFLRGGSLEDLIALGPLAPERAAAILDQTAAALAAAHRQGVVHRDVKPGNVLLDDEGNAYLTDFGVALDAGAPERTSGTMMRGTPAYLSPEQIRLETATPQSDVYALGVVLYEMLTGEHPFPETSLTALLDQHLREPLPSVRELRPDLPDEIDDVIARATAKDANTRFSDPLQVATAFRTALEGSAAVSEPPRETRNPYKGLRAFLEADALDFFGRETVTDRLVRRLEEDEEGARFLAVVGPSGSGKSSVVRAGLVPALRRGALPGSEHWYVIDLLPGSQPFRELESALLGVAVEPPPSLLDELRSDVRGLVRAADRVLPDPDAELLIVLDQLEEVFTLVDRDERARLLESLEAAAFDPDSRVRVVTTLRADFFDAPLSVHAFGRLLADRTEAIPAMSPEEIERAIVAPADRAGLAVEPRLVAAMVADVVDRPGALPLLQYALTELAERRTDGMLTLEGYRRVGGVSGALARRAEQLHEGLNEQARDACRQLFLRLVTLGEGSEDTRRRIRRSELVPLADARVMDGVIETFGRHRLLSFDRDPGTREPTVEIAHEALLWAWSRLNGWIGEAREDLRTRNSLAASAAGWESANRDESFLLRGARLEQLATWAETTSVALSATDEEYLDASTEHRDAEREAERVRHEREWRLERRALTRLRALVAVLAASSLIAASLTVIAVNRSLEAGRLRVDSLVNTLTSTSVASLETDPELSLLLALNAIDAVPAGDQVPAGTVEALHWAIQEAGIAYPAADGPVAVVAGPLGQRGVLDLPLPTLVDAARAHIRSLTPEDCARFQAFDVTCASARGLVAEDLTAEPVRAQQPADAVRPLAGTKVVLWTVYNPVWAKGLRGELERFTERTGIVVEVEGQEFFEQQVAEGVATWSTPDLAMFPQPGGVAEYARQGRLNDLGAYVDITQVTRDRNPYLVSLGTVAPDGSWPSYSGGMYGALVDLSMKSQIWYPVPELREDYGVPDTWGELIDISDRLIADGQNPWCLGFASGGGTDGWPGTDWIENLVLAGSGQTAYDRWVFHEVPFDNPAVRAAFKRLDRILFRDGAVLGGAEGTLETLWDEAQFPMVERDPPGCWLYLIPTFGAKVLPEGSIGSQTDFFPFPGVSRQTSDGVLGGGNMMAAFSDRPEVREVVRFLLGPEYGAEWAGLDHGFISANRRFDLDNYPPFWRHQAKLLRTALDKDSFRFDGSDLMPSAIGQDLFWNAMMRYAAQGPDSLDAILTELEAAWPDDTS